MTPIERAKADELKLRREISKLDIQITIARSQHQKVLAYIELAELYEADGGTVTDSPRARGGVSTTAVRISTEAIKERGAPIHTRELIELLAQQDVFIGGSNPIANLSGFLSRSDELRADRGRGWGLAAWGDPADWPQGASVKITRPKLMTDEEKASTRAQEPPSDKVATNPTWAVPSPDDLDDDIPF